MRRTVWTNIWVLCATAAGFVQSSANVSSRHLLHSTDIYYCSEGLVRFFLEDVSYDHQGCIYLIKDTVKAVVLWNVSFSAASTPVSRDPSEITAIC